VDIPEEEKLKKPQITRGIKWSYIANTPEIKANRWKILDLYTEPRRRPLYSLQVLCLIEISKNNHPEEEIYTLQYNFKDPKSEDIYWQINISDPYLRPIALNLQPYTQVQLARYIKPRYLDWVKAGGFYLYQQIKGWLASDTYGQPFYIDLWKVIEEKESKLLQSEDTSLEKNVCQQKANQEPGSKAP
jgi:hypothetical protein